jgi:hypothetical protein
MALGLERRSRLQSEAPAREGGPPRWAGAELAGYAVLAIGLAALLWSRIGDVDGYYLDEWIYVHGAEYIWDHLPGGLIDPIPLWDRGPQRLYSTLIAPLWGALPTSTAYTWAHLLNVVLLVSAIVPLALLARRLIDSPVLRVLAVALAAAIPWLTIGSHLLTESLAFPLYIWSVYAIVLSAEEPSLWRQAGALLAIAALGLCRLNLGVMVVVLFAAVLVGEAMRRRSDGDGPLGPWVARALRRQWLVAAAAAVTGLVAVALALRGGAGVSSRYGGLDFESSIDRLFGPAAEQTWRTMATYLRGLVVGSFVFPFAIGSAAAFAGVAGRLGRRFVVPSLVALLGLAVVVLVVGTSTVGGALEERYVMYGYPPLAILAVAGLANAERLRWWLIPGSAATVYLLSEGIAAPAFNSGHFFAAPGGAFWSRVVQHRLVGWEDDLLGWTSISPRGWLLVAAGLAAMVVFVVVAARRGGTRVIVPVLGAGLALCAVAQALELDYDFKQELYGTAEAPGGIAVSPNRGADRDTWLDDLSRPDAGMAVMPGLIAPAAPSGGTETLQFWNRSLDVTVSVNWNGTLVPAPPGYSVAETQLGADGLARWLTRPPWLAANRNDPRVQFQGRLVARSRFTRYGLYRTGSSGRAVWTAVGLQPDGAVVKGAPVGMTLDRAAAEHPMAVTITMRAAEGATRPVEWRLTLDGHAARSGELRPNRVRDVRVPVPECSFPGERCQPVRWELRASGRPVGLPLPGAPAAPRPVLLYVDAARIAVNRP